VPDYEDIFPAPSEDELWELLRRLLEDPKAVASIRRISIKGWRPELFYLPDEPIGHSLSPSVAQAITEFHRQLQRSYAYLAYGETRATLLSAEDRRLLDVRFIATDGSSGLEVADEIVDALVLGLIGKMSGEQITLAILVFLLLFFSQSFGRYWINEHYSLKRRNEESDERMRLSEQETERAKIMATALSQHPELAPLKDGSDGAKMSLVKAAKNFDRSRVQGADLTAKEARIITKQAKAEGEGRRIDGLFEIARINPEYEEGHIFRLKREDSDDEFEAQANYSELTSEDIHILYKAAENKSYVYAFVNAWFIDGRITRATIVRVNEPDEGS